MTPIEFFKLQAKNLHKDYKTKKPFFDEVVNDYLYDYSPKYFDIDRMFSELGWADEDNFTLMKAQHFIALMVGFKKWANLVSASEDELKLAKLLFDNRIHIQDWEIYIDIVEQQTKIDFDDPESQLNLLEGLLDNGSFTTTIPHYRLN